VVDAWITRGERGLAAGAVTTERKATRPSRGLSGGLDPWEDRAVDDRAVHTAEPSAAALAVENERLQRALRARLREEAALRRVATLVAQQHAPEEVFTLVTEEVARHVDADAAITVRYDAPGLATVVATRTPRLGTSVEVGRQIVLVPETSLARVQATLAPARVDSFEGLPGDYAAEMRAIGLRAAVAAPILVDGHLWGAVGAGSRSGPFTEEAAARIGAFAELVAQAIANVDARIKLKESRARIVEAGDEARRRIERDLHDGAQQRLVGVALSLRLVARSAEAATAAAIEDCIEELLTALAELRELAHGLHPVVLSERGLVPALQMLAARSPVPVVLNADLAGRLLPTHEAALYFVAAEALTNVAKYAEASAAEVTLRCQNGWAAIAIADDGIGGARTEAGSGLRGLCDRVEALGGRLTLASEPGAGTTVCACVPVATDGSAEIF
jgi:signal transduction histidine kinase